MPPSDRYIGRQAGQQSGRQKVRQTDIQTDKQTNRKTYFEIFIMYIIFIYKYYRVTIYRAALLYIINRGHYFPARFTALFWLVSRQALDLLP